MGLTAKAMHSQARPLPSSALASFHKVSPFSTRTVFATWDAEGARGKRIHAPTRIRSGLVNCGFSAANCRHLVPLPRCRLASLPRESPRATRRPPAARSTGSWVGAVLWMVGLGGSAAGTGTDTDGGMGVSGAASGVALPSPGKSLASCPCRSCFCRR